MGKQSCILSLRQEFHKEDSAIRESICESTFIKEKSYKEKSYKEKSFDLKCKYANMLVELIQGGHCPKKESKPCDECLYPVRY